MPADDDLFDENDDNEDDEENDPIMTRIMREDDWVLRFGML
jgi:hypothetical protein